MAREGGGMRLRPMGVGDVLDETFRLYRRHFSSFVLVMAVVAVPVALFSTALNLGLGLGGLQGRLESGRDLAPALVVGGLLVLVGGIGYLLSSGAAVRLASDAILGRPLDVRAAYRVSFGRLRSLYLATLLTSLATGLLLITCIGIPFAVYFGIGWSVTYPTIVLEPLGCVAAMRRSSGLIGGHRWRVLGIVVLISLLVGILVSLPSGIVGALTGVLTTVAPAPGSLIAAQVVNGIMSALGQALFGSVIWITVTILYYELRVRKEAFDLEQLAERAEALPPPPFYEP